MCAVLQAAAHQPVSVAIQADERPFQLYQGGVFDAPCGTALDHGVLVRSCELSAVCLDKTIAAMNIPAVPEQHVPHSPECLPEQQQATAPHPVVLVQLLFCSCLFNMQKCPLHAAQVAGYGHEVVNGTNKPYWLVKNSWGPAWGDNGYIKCAPSPTFKLFSRQHACHTAAAGWSAASFMTMHTGCRGSTALILWS